MTSFTDLGVALRRSLEQPPSTIRRTIVNQTRPSPWHPHHEATGSIFIHIPRTAGGSVTDALYDGAERGHTPYYVFAYTRPEMAARLYSFAIVRNPWDRFVSAYHRVLGTAKSRATRDWAARNVKPFADFDIFVQALKTNARLRWIVLSYPHFRPQFEYLAVDGKPAVSFIGHFESLQEDFKTIAEQVRPGAILGHKHKSDHTHYRDYYNEETADIVRNLYKDDISAFGYTF